MDPFGQILALIFLLAESILQTFEIKLLCVYKRIMSFVKFKLFWLAILITISLNFLSGTIKLRSSMAPRSFSSCKLLPVVLLHRISLRVKVDNVFSCLRLVLILFDIGIFAPYGLICCVLN